MIRQQPTAATNWSALKLGVSCIGFLFVWFVCILTIKVFQEMVLFTDTGWTNVERQKAMRKLIKVQEKQSVIQQLNKTFIVLRNNRIRE